MSIVDILAMSYVDTDFVYSVLEANYPDHPRDVMRALSAGQFHNVDWLEIS